jgi:hypothetical protein
LIYTILYGKRILLKTFGIVIRFGGLRVLIIAGFGNIIDKVLDI